MKKTNFAILILLAVCVTVAGAYASWNYVTGNNIAAVENQAIQVNLAAKNEKDVEGTLSVSGTWTATIDDTNDDYRAELILNGGDINVTCKNDGQDVSVNMYAEITVSEVKYNNTNILTVKTAKIYSNGATANWQITTAKILECLELAEISLPTPNDYDAFNEVLGANELSISITFGAVSDTTSD